MKKKICVALLSMSTLLDTTTLLAADQENFPGGGVVVSAPSSVRHMPKRATLSAIPSQYVSRINTGGLMEDAQYDHFIVYYRDSAEQNNAIQSVAATNNARVSHSKNVAVQETGVIAVGGRVIKTSKAMNASEAQAFMLEYLQSDDVEFIEPNAIMLPTLAPNDPGYGKQWYLNDVKAGISAESAWDKATGNGVVVAVIDTGITSHSDLNGQILPGYNFIKDPLYDRNRNGRSADATDPGDWRQEGDPCAEQLGVSYSTWHGTHVSGILAAATNNGVGIAGTAFNSKILPVRVLGRCGGFTSDIAEAIVWASGGHVEGVPGNPNPAKVINLSLGGYGACSMAYRRALAIARTNGAIVVAAAGNGDEEGNGIDVSGFEPSNCPGVIAVGSSDKTRNRSRFSNYGSLITVMAPGSGDEWIAETNILSTFNIGDTVPEDEAYAYLSGTSMAAPQVSGVIALLLEKQPNLTFDQVRHYITSTATSMEPECAGGCGAGLINADAALSALMATPPVQPYVIPIEPNQSVPNLSSKLGDGDGNTWYKLTLPVGAKAFKIAAQGGTGSPVLNVTTDHPDVGIGARVKPICDGIRICQLAFPALAEERTLYINVGTRSFYGNTTLATHVTPAPIPLDLGWSMRGITEDWSDQQAYSFTTPHMGYVTITAEGGTGGAAIFTVNGTPDPSNASACGVVRPYISRTTCSTRVYPGMPLYIYLKPFGSSGQVRNKVLSVQLRRW